VSETKEREWTGGISFDSTDLLTGKTVKGIKLVPVVHSIYGIVDEIVVPNDATEEQIDLWKLQSMMKKGLV
jgi:hypothetical protein